MDSIDIQVSASAKSANTELDNLIVKLSAVSKSLSSIGGKSTNFGTQMSKQINTATKSVDSMSSSMNKATKSTTSLASAFGTLYANFFWVQRMFTGLWNSIDSTADYMESYNYFNVAFNKIANDWSGDFEKYGYENGEAYAESFTDRMDKVFAKLSGIEFDHKNMRLASNEVKNLGLNIKEITQYAAQLGSVTNSVGLTGESSLTASSTFTKLAGDLSSLYNVDYSSVSKNLQSGLIGQSRALYKYGIDITNATLQTYAYELGLEKAVSEMTQAEKMQLRMIAILDQSKVAWGNLANEIDQPSNQIRIFKNNLSEAAQVLGQLFMPILQKVMPIVNGITIAIKNLLSNIAGIMGIELKFGSTQATDEMADSYEGVEDSLEGVTDSAKKAKGQLRGFDELNIISTSDSSSSGSGGAGSSIDLTQDILKAAEEYQKVWDEAYAQMENRAQAVADSLSGIFKPVEKLFKDIKIGDWFAVGGDVSTIASGIFNFFSKAIANVDWQILGNNIGLFLVGIDWTDIFSSLGELIGNTIEGLVEAYEWTFNVAPLETAIISAVGLLKFTPVGAIISKKIAQGIASIVGLEIAANAGIKTALVGVGGLMANTLNAGFQAMLGNKAALSALSFINPIIVNITGIASVIGGAGIAFTNFFDMLENGFSWFNEMLMVVGVGLTAVGAIILGAPAGITAVIAGIVAAVGTLVVVIHDNWDSIVEWTSNLFDKVSGFFGDLWDKVSEIWSVVSTWFNENVIQPVIGFFVGFSTRVGQVFEGLWIIVQAIWKIASGWFNTNVVQPIINFFSPIVSKISGYFSSLWNSVKSVWSSVSNWFNVNIAIPVANAFKIACDKIGGFFSSLWAGVKKGVVSAMNGVIGGIESAINFIVKGINKIIKGFNKVVSWAAEVAEVDWGGVDLVPTVYLSRIPAYEVGGFPEDGLFFANHNELVGQFSNGKTAVANNEQIVAGIKAGVREAVAEVLAPYLADIAESNREVANKDFTVASTDVFNAVRTESSNYTRRTGRPAFI